MNGIDVTRHSRIQLWPAVMFDLHLNSYFVRNWIKQLCECLYVFVCVPKHFNHNTSLAILLTLFSSIGYYLRLFQQNKNATCFVFELEISISNLVESFDWFNFDWILSSSTSPPLFKSSIIGVNMVCLWIVLIITHQWRIEPRWMEVNSNHSTNSH